ncbi:putative mitochondrial carrier protein [Rhizodiscina lignyota]|uniref:Mitochondrial carrier protein n=1 Tax=Rhizodiscina lignyota TaxID=1504668 RepID=A0A9P4MBI2_9PEZI|nr:putative mitochondrial carrier protein [Rhizodiscina lignyota]
MTSPLDGRPVDFPPSSALGDGRKPKNNAATGASAAGSRAIIAQMVQFYFRAPVKAFFRTRVDYMGYARAINPRVKENAPWSLKTSTPGLLAYAVKNHGWSFIPRQVLPPLLANVSVGAVLYTSYLQTLAALYEPAARSQKRVHPPPPLVYTFTAGFSAGSIQSLVAAPLDALQVRFKTSEMLEGRWKSMWHYAYDKLRTIGPQGVFAGYTLTFLKDSLGYGAFFAAFEYTKSQAYYGFLTRVYGNQSVSAVLSWKNSAPATADGKPPVIRPHYALEPAFLLLAGVSASVAQQLIQHPLTQIQNVHYNRLESLDYAAKLQRSRPSIFRLYYHAYEKTYEQCKRQARRIGGWRRWLYKDFLWNTIRQTPSTSAGLIVFELVRRRYGIGNNEVRIQQDGYDILLS